MKFKFYPKFKLQDDLIVHWWDLLTDEEEFTGISIFRHPINSFLSGEYSVNGICGFSTLDAAKRSALSEWRETNPWRREETLEKWRNRRPLDEWRNRRHAQRN